jgi:hypothetical protein
MSLETKVREAFERHANDVRRSAGDAWPGVERRIERSHRIRMIGSLAGAAVVIAAAVVAGPRLGERTLEPVMPPISAPTDVPKLVARIPVRAVALAAGEDALWAITPSDTQGRGMLRRIDPLSDRVTGAIRIGMDPVAVAVGEGSVWVLHGEGCGWTGPCEPGITPPSWTAAEALSVWRIDARSLEVEDRIRVGTRYDLTFDARHAWVASPGAEGLVRIEGSAEWENAYRPWGSVAGAGPVHLAIGGGTAWVVSHAAESDDRRPLLSVIDLSRRELIDVIDIVASGGATPDLALGFGSVWVTTGTETSASGLMRIDPASRRIVGRIALADAAPVGLTSITTGYGYVWATSTRGYLGKVDPSTNAAPIDPLLIGAAPPVSTSAVVAGFGSIWVAADDGEIWRFVP